MISRRLILALPLLALPLLAVPGHAQPADALTAAVIICWRARGIDFMPAQLAARIGNRQGKAALQALAGVAASADGEEVETAVEILWEAGAPPSPAWPLMARDLAHGLPLLLLAHDGRAWLLESRDGDLLIVSDPMTREVRVFTLATAALIGRPVIAGA